MHCPFCDAIDTRVIDSRLSGEGVQVRRRRECDQCQARFTTYEVADITLPRVIKRDGTRVSFDTEKLRSGMLRALEKRPVPVEKVDEAVQSILHLLHLKGEREIAASLLGEWVMDALKGLDDVAYVRFASVYRRFQDVNAFHQEIQRMLMPETSGDDHDN